MGSCGQLALRVSHTVVIRCQLGAESSEHWHGTGFFIHVSGTWCGVARIAEGHHQHLFPYSATSLTCLGFLPTWISHLQLTFPRMTLPRDQGESSQVSPELASETTQYPFCPILLVTRASQAQPRFKGSAPPKGIYICRGQVAEGSSWGPATTGIKGDHSCKVLSMNVSIYHK